MNYSCSTGNFSSTLVSTMCVRLSIAILGLALLLPSPAYALRAQADTAGLEDTLRPAAGLEERPAAQMLTIDEILRQGVAASERGSLLKLRNRGYENVVLIRPEPNIIVLPSLLHIIADASIAEWVGRISPDSRQSVILREPWSEILRMGDRHPDIPTVVIRDTLVSTGPMPATTSFPILLVYSPTLSQIEIDGAVRTLLRSAASFAGRTIDFTQGPIGRVALNEQGYSIYPLVAAVSAGLEESNPIMRMAQSRRRLTLSDVYRINAWVHGIDGAAATTYAATQARWLENTMRWAPRTVRNRQLIARAQRRQAGDGEHLRQVLRWLQDDGSRDRIDRYPMIVEQLIQFQELRIDCDDPVVRAALAHWFLTGSRARGRFDGTHRTAWLLMNVLLARAGRPMIAQSPPGKSALYYRHDLHDDPRRFIGFVRARVARAEHRTRALHTVRILDCTSWDAHLYRMLMAAPRAARASSDLFMTKQPLTILYRSEPAGRVARQAVRAAMRDRRPLGLKPGTIRIQRLDLRAQPHRYRRAIVVRMPEDAPLREERDARWRRAGMAIVILDPAMPLPVILQHALTQWLDKPNERVAPVKAIVDRPQRLELWT